MNKAGDEQMNRDIKTGRSRYLISPRPLQHHHPSSLMT